LELYQVACGWDAPHTMAFINKKVSKHAAPLHIRHLRGRRYSWSRAPVPPPETERPRPPAKAQRPHPVWQPQAAKGRVDQRQLAADRHLVLPQGHGHQLLYGLAVNRAGADAYAGHHQPLRQCGGFWHCEGLRLWRRADLQCLRRCRANSLEVNGEVVNFLETS
jgi:hypothetical protein